MLTKVVLTNYRQFTSKEVILDGSLHIIQGRNATGKSTVVEAIAYALQGSSVQKGKGGSWVKEGESNGGVDLYLDDIVISRHTNKQTVSDSNGNIIARGHTGINEYIERRYKLVPDLFKTSFYIGQKDVDSFAGLTPLERTKRVEKLLRIDILDDIKKEVSDKSKLIKSDVANLTNKLAANPFSETTISTLESTVKKLEANLEEAKEALTSLERKDAVYQEALVKWQKKLQWQAKLDSRPKEVLERDIVDLESRITTAHKADETNRLADEKDSLEKKLQGITINENYFKLSISQIMDHKSVVETNKKLLKELEKYSKVADVELSESLADEVATVKESYSKVKSAYETLLASPEVCSTCGQKMPDAKLRAVKLTKLSDDLVKLETEHTRKSAELAKATLKAGIKTEPLQLEDSIDTVLSIIEAKPYYERLQSLGNVKRIDCESVEDLKKQLKTAQDGLTTLELYKEYDDITEEPEKVDLLQARKNYNSVVSMLRTHKEDLSNQQAAQAIHKLYKDDLIDKENKVLQYTKLVKFIDTYRKEFSENIIPLLSDNVTKIMSYLTEGKYDKVTISKDYSIENYDMLSGSEEDSVNFALRLAIAQISRLGDFNTMMLDEIAASFDSVKEGLLLDILKSTNMQLIYISHGQLDN